MSLQVAFIRTLTCFLLWSVSMPLFAQSNWEPATYFGVPERHKHNVFIDEFKDNRQQWDLGSLYLTEEITEDKFRCTSHGDGDYVKVQPISFDTKADFELETSLRFVKGMGSEDHLGLVFGRDIYGNQYEFLFNAEMDYQVVRNNRGRRIVLEPWQAISNQRLRLRHSFNKLTVRQISRQWYFFINEELVTTLPARDMPGNRVGFMLGGHMSIEVEYMRAAQIRTKDIQGPNITLLEPQFGGVRNMTFEKNRQLVRGKVQDMSGLSELLINGQAISVSADGIFKASVILPDGITDIEFIATDRMGNTSREVYTFEYIESPYFNSPTVEQAPAPAYAEESFDTEDTYDDAVDTNEGSNYLLLIGINQYEEWNPLHNAVKDCQDISTTLTQFYNFEADNVIRLFNENASREGILETFEDLQKMIDKDDNLLIYYAGHGYYDAASELGYWVPSDARINKIPDFIRNSTIHDYLRTIDSKHTLLIADACYAGSLFAFYRGEQLNQNARSRWAFTSGDIEKVWDGQPGENSPFARYLIRYLRTNTKNNLPANELIDAVKLTVERNTAQTPVGSPLKGAGDNGGIFTFQLRK